MKNKSVISRLGFTLIEILVVVAIIGVLAGVVLVGLRGTGPQARDSRRVADLRQVQNGLELYYNKEGFYPDTMTWSTLQTTLMGADIGVANVPADPKSGSEYLYYSDGSTYVLAATLEQKGSSLVANDTDDVTVPAAVAAPVGTCGTNSETEVEYCVQL